MGNIIGPLMVKIINGDTQIQFLKLTHPYFKNIYLEEYHVLGVLKSSFINNLIFIISIGILGLINIGVIFIPIIIFLKGIFIGFSVSFLVYQFGIKGFLASLLGIYPQNLLIILGLVGIGAIGMIKSSNLDFIFKRKSVLRQDFNTGEYIILLSVFTVIIMIGSLIEGIFSPIIMKIIIKNFI